MGLSKHAKFASCSEVLPNKLRDAADLVPVGNINVGLLIDVTSMGSAEA